MVFLIVVAAAADQPRVRVHFEILLHVRDNPEETMIIYKQMQEAQRKRKTEARPLITRYVTPLPKKRGAIDSLRQRIHNRVHDGKRIIKLFRIYRIFIWSPLV